MYDPNEKLRLAVNVERGLEANDLVRPQLHPTFRAITVLIVQNSALSSNVNTADKLKTC